MSDLETYARTRDPQLKEQLVLRHLPLAKFVARRMSAKLPAHVDLDDLVSMGVMGLMDAIEKFDPGRGHQFSTYAVTRIRGEILDGLQRMEWAPKQVVSAVRKMRRVQEQLTNELGYEPTEQQLAEALGISEDGLAVMRRDDEALRFKAAEPEDSDDVTHGETWADPLAEEQQTAGEVAELRRRLARALAHIQGDEQKMLLMYYRDGMTLKEIAARMGISGSSAIQSHTRMIDRVRLGLAAQG